MVEQERKHQQPHNKHGKASNRPQNRRARLRAWIRVRWRWIRIRRWQIARWATLIVVVVSGLVLTSRYVSKDTDPIQFITGNLLNILIFAAIVAQVLIYRKQRDIMGQQWQAMRGQLKAIKKQAGFMETQTEAALKAADMAMGQLIVMRDTLRHNQEQALKDAIDRVKQFQIMDKQALISETQMEIAGEAAKITERQLEAMQGQLDAMNQQIEIDRQQVKLGIDRERAIIGIRRITPTGLDDRVDRDGKGAVSVKITFRNGGHTSAWGFRAGANVEVGYSPREFEWVEASSPVRQFFIPEGEDRNVDFAPPGLVDTRSVYNGEKYLFVDGEARYSTLGGERILCFGATWNEDKKEFLQRYQHERIDLEIQDSVHGHTAENVTLQEERAKPKPDEGNKEGNDKNEKGNPN